MFKSTKLLTFLDFLKILAKNRHAQDAHKAKVLTQHIVVVAVGSPYLYFITTIIVEITDISLKHVALDQESHIAVLRLGHNTFFI